MKVIYVHHGERLMGNPPSTNDDLTKLGYEDCELVKEFLKRYKNKIKTIYSSVHFRCTKTAEIINQNLNVPVILDERLNEFGSIKNETWENLQKRILQFLNEVVENYENDDYVVCVTSGVNIGAFILKAFNLEPSENTPFLQIVSCSPVCFEYKK